MNRLSKWIGIAGDRMNPVAVKEFRQAVQSRWVVAVLMLFLLINLAMIGCYLMLSPDAETSVSGGREVFSFLMVILMLTCISFVPLYSGIRLSLERNDSNVDLLFISTITPGAIVRGKYLTAMALTLLIFSTCMPFMVLTYLLRGIDLPTIFFTLGWGFMFCAVANAMGVFAGCVPGSWLIRGFVASGVLVALCFFSVGMIEMIDELSRFGMGRMFISSFWSGIAWTATIVLLAIGLLHVLSVAMLSPKTANRMFIPRLYITACWAILGAASVYISFVESTAEPILVWSVISGVLLMISTAAALGERDSWSNRVRRKIPRNPLLRMVAFLFYTGSVGGIAWNAILFVSTIAVVLSIGGFISSLRFSGDVYDVAKHLSYVYGYILCYCLTIAAFRLLMYPKIATPSLSVFAAFFGVLVCLVPYLIAFFVERDWWHSLPYYMVGSPMVLTMNDDIAKSIAAVFMGFWLLTVFLASLPWALGQWRRFKPIAIATPAQSEVVAADTV